MADERSTRNPRPWLISTARFKAIDTLRRRARFDASQDELVRYLEAQSNSAQRSNEDHSFEDDRLRLIFTRCHPALLPEARVALTLREVCGLTIDEIAKGLPHHSTYAGAADRARRGKDSRHTDSARGTGTADLLAQSEPEVYELRSQILKKSENIFFSHPPIDLQAIFPYYIRRRSSFYPASML